VDAKLRPGRRWNADPDNHYGRSDTMADPVSLVLLVILYEKLRK
jgi:hypothetical protein